MTAVFGRRRTEAEAPLVSEVTAPAPSFAAPEAAVQELRQLCLARIEPAVVTSLPP